MQVNSTRPFRNFYGRRYGKRLRPGQRRLLDENLEPLSVPRLSSASLSTPSEIVCSQLFGRDRPVWLEIGFGAGEHLVHQAQCHPEVNILGCEPFINGVASLLGKLRDQPLANIRIHPGDVRDVMDILPDASISRAFLLYPDPWPKKRHHRRRFMNPEFLTPLARVMTRGSQLRLATDVADYARQALEQIRINSPFFWVASNKRDWETPWDHWPSTRYEAKACREGRKPIYLTFRRE